MPDQNDMPKAPRRVEEVGLIERARMAMGKNPISALMKLREQYGKENISAQTEGGEQTGTFQEWLTRKGYSMDKNGDVVSGSDS